MQCIKSVVCRHIESIGLIRYKRLFKPFLHKHSHGVIGIFGEEAQIHDKEVSDNQYGVKSLLEQEYPMEIMNWDSISTLLEHRLITLMLQEMLQ